MTSDKGQEIVNLLLLALGITWVFKIASHFRYLRSIRTIKESNFISFFLNPENLFRTILIVSPFFFLKKGDRRENEKRNEKGLTLLAYALWLMFAVAFYYLYKHPATKGIQKVEYDLTKETEQ